MTVPRNIEQIRAWNEKTLSDWAELVGTHSRERQAQDALAYALAELKAAEELLLNSIKECGVCGGDGIETFLGLCDEDLSEACAGCADVRAYFTQRGRAV